MMKEHLLEIIRSLIEEEVLDQVLCVIPIRVKGVIEHFWPVFEEHGVNVVLSKFAIRGATKVPW